MNSVMNTTCVFSILSKQLHMQTHIFALNQANHIHSQKKANTNEDQPRPFFCSHAVFLRKIFNVCVISSKFLEHFQFKREFHIMGHTMPRNRMKIEYMLNRMVVMLPLQLLLLCQIMETQIWSSRKKKREIGLAPYIRSIQKFCMTVFVQKMILHFLKSLFCRTLHNKCCTMLQHLRHFENSITLYGFHGSHNAHASV